MWGVNPKILCRQHLLGEHLELHMLVGNIARGRSINGYITRGLIDPSMIYERHKVLVAEMLNRGYRHQSPLSLQPQYEKHPLDLDKNLAELMHRCKECKARAKM